MISSLLTIIFYFAVGLSVLSLAKRLALSPLQSMAVGFGVGSGFVGIELFLLSLIGIPWSKELVFLSWIILIAIRRRHLWKITSAVLGRGFLRKRTVYEAIFFFAVIVVIAYVFTEATIRPVHAWDAVATWFILAKAFFLEQGVSPGIYRYLNVEAPPLFSLQVATFYIFQGSVTGTVPALLLSFYFFCLALIFYNGLETYTNKKVAIFFTFLFVTTQALIRQGGKFDVGYADLPLSYYFFVSAMLFVEYMRRGRWEYLFFSVLLAGFSGLIKNDGVPFFLALLFLGSVIAGRNARMRHLFAVLGGSTVVLLWWIYRTYFDIPPHYLSQGRIVLSRIPTILTYASGEFFNIIRWHLLWILFFPALLLIRKNRMLVLLSLLVLYQIVVYLSIYTMTPIDTLEHMHGSFDRLLLHVAPLALFVISIAFHKSLTRYVG